MLGCVFAIKKFAVHDGPGIRTTLFMKGCPLDCLWCHNPEGKSYKREIAFFAHKCALCGNCKMVCDNQQFNPREIDRTKCIACGKCATACFSDALTVYGEDMTVDDAFKALIEDKDFYLTSNGGATISGGECLMQADFVAEVLKKLKEENIHTAVDTCGYVPESAFKKVIPYTDIFLYDIKAFSEETHIKCTGKSNKLIWDNLAFLDKNNKKVIIRYPVIPEYNDFEAEAIAQRLSGFNNIESVDILQYHNFSGSKYDALGLKNTMPDVEPPAKERLDEIRNVFSSYGLKVNKES